jgi:hypothetical protein
MNLRSSVFRNFKATMTGVAATLLLLQACEKSVELPAKKLSGSWITTQPVYFFSASDSCTRVYQAYDSTPVSLRWDIVYKKDNLVGIDVASEGAGTRTSYDTCNLPSNLPFPYELHGVVGTATMVVEVPYPTYDSAGAVDGTAYSVVGTFNYTDNSITGSLNDKVCDSLHCRGYQSRPNSITLRRQN